MKRYIFYVFLFLSLGPALVSSNAVNNAVRIDFEGMWQSSKEISGVYARNDTAYIANGTDGIVRLDLTVPSAPAELGRTALENATRIIGRDNWLYVLSHGLLQSSQVQKDRIYICDISGETVDIEGEYLHDSYRNLGDMAVSGSTLFVTTGDSVIAIDISDPAHPVTSGRFDLGSTNLVSPGIRVIDATAYIAAGSKHFKILDVSDPADISLIGEYETDMWAAKVDVSNGIAYITGWEKGILAIDVHDPYAPVKVGDYSMTPPLRAIDFRVRDNFGYLSYINPENRDAGIIAFCLDTVSDMKPVGEYTDLEWGNDLFFMDDYLLCANENNLTVLKPFPYRKIESNLQVVPTRLSLSEGNTARISVVGGLPPFYAGTSDPSIATAVVENDHTVNLTALSRGNVMITVTDITGAQAVLRLTVTQVEKVIIVAGSGPYDGNHLWPATLACTQYAYKVLRYQGYTDSTIQYLATDTLVDINGDGVFTEVDGNASTDTLRDAILNWAADARNVLIYMSGHGSDGSFRIGEHEQVDAGRLDLWFADLERRIPGRIIFIYDACQAGSFLGDLISDSLRERVLIASAAANESAYFTSHGSLSFSWLFWGQIQNGGNLLDAFLIAKNAIQYTYTGQTPSLDDNGNGQPDDDDGTLSKNIHIGNGLLSAGDIPVIGSASSDTILNGETALVIHADHITGSSAIQKVWAVVTPPGFSPHDPDTPVLSVPTVEMNATDDTRYEGIYNNFDAAGTYHVAIFAADTGGSISLPKRVTVIQKTPACPVDIRGCSVSGDPMVHTPLTFTVNAASSCSNTLYYRFSMHPDYGGPGYDGTRWTRMTDSEYQTDNHCTYAFTEPGEYMVVVWVTPGPDQAGTAVPIIGLSVDIGDDLPSGTVITGSAANGTRQAGNPISFSVNGHNTSPTPLYYRFSHHPYYGTTWYDGRHWSPMTDTEWVPHDSIDYTFVDPGHYIVVVWVSDSETPADSAGIPMVGWSMDVR